jgi:hypothetical protein
MAGRIKLTFVAIAATAALMGPLALRAAAVTNACTNGMFPNQPGGNSELSLACTLTTATGGAGNAYSIEDFPDAVWHTGAARLTAADGHITAASATVTSATGRFVAGDVDHIIAGGLLPAGTFIKTFVNTTTVTINAVAPTGSTTTTAVLTIENGTGRGATGSTTAGSKVVTSTTANFVAGDAGRGISATAIPHGDTIASVTNSTSIMLLVAATTTSATKKISIADSATLTSNRQLKDAHTTNLSVTVTSATAVFGPTDVGLPVTGTGIPAGDYVATAPTATTITLHAAATATSTAAVLTIGQPNSGAALNGETVAQLSSKLSLDPTGFGGAVDGVPPCTANVINASSLSGYWNNPGSYNGTALGSSTDPMVKGPTVGQIVFPTSLISFGGYVTQVKAATAGETQTLAHYDVVLPLLLTSAVVCPAPSTVGVASVFRFDATSVNQGKTGVGDLRALKDFPTGTTTKSTTAYIHVIKTGSPNTNLFTGSTACVETYPGSAAFSCGNG